MKRLVILLPVLLAFQVGVQPALAWTWPVDGPVLRPFELGSDPYAAGQHRGIDIGAPTGASVRAPAAGSVSFAGTVPVGGRTVTIRTAGGYSVTLVHLGSIGVVRGTNVAAGSAVGTVGPSGDPKGRSPTCTWAYASRPTRTAISIRSRSCRRATRPRPLPIRPPRPSRPGRPRPRRLRPCRRRRSPPRHRRCPVRTHPAPSGREAESAVSARSSPGRRRSTALRRASLFSAGPA
jgi:Peptidase family M23